MSCKLSSNQEVDILGTGPCTCKSMEVEGAGCLCCPFNGSALHEDKEQGVSGAEE